MIIDFPPIFDGHNDTLLDLYKGDNKNERSFFRRDERGHIDLARAREGGFGGGFFAIFVPSQQKEKSVEPEDNDLTNKEDLLEYEAPVKPDYARIVTAEMMAKLASIEKESDGQFKIVLTTDDLENCLNQGIIAAVMHFEGAEVIDPDLSNLETYYNSGLRSIGITWSRINAFGSGVPFEYPRSPNTGPGLSYPGKNLVKKCNQLGIMIDLSHLNEKGFWDVAAISKAPLVATHAAAHTICPATRNLTDNQLDAIKDSNGIVGINFHVGFVRPDGKNEPNTPISNIVDHLEYVIARLGVDHVAFGSDFDGAIMPAELKDVSGLPKIIQMLRDRGHDDTTIGKLANENWLRVLRATWKN